MTLIHQFLAFANESYGLSPAQIDGEMNSVYARGDKLMGCFIIGHIALALMHAMPFGTWSVAIPVAMAATGMFFVSVAMMPGSVATRFVAGLCSRPFARSTFTRCMGFLRCISTFSPRRP